MKNRVVTFLLSAAFICVAVSAVCADPDPAPFIDNQVKQLTAAITKDVASGKLSQTDADELMRAVNKVKNTVQGEPSLTPKTRADLRAKLSKIDADLARKEKQTQAAASASPTM